MTKNILFLVTGMTPQIITETVWALACDPEREDKWIPDEIHVMSTEHGLNQIRDRLLNKGNLKKLIEDYQLRDIQFDENCLHAIHQNGKTLTDLKTPEDNELAGDAICTKIREFCQNDQVSLHVSIAGGRKTMGFYAGYALSLYGRAQDRMSHVLVEDNFETIPDFYYPTAKSDFVTDRNGKVWDAKDAKVWLAEIAFVRMKEAIKDRHQLKQNDAFSQVVAKINDSFKDVKLTINVHNKTLIINDKYTVDNLPAREFAILHWFADLRKQGKAGIVAPTKNIIEKGISADDIRYIGKLTTEFTSYYEELKNTEDREVDVDKNFFNSIKSRLKSAFETSLGLELAAKISISQKNKGQPFALDLAAEQIEIVDTFKG